jgi:UDP-N-acetylmuramoylalanine--D-glutamate ligase
MKIAILGYDVEGRSSFEYFAAQGHELTIRDRNAGVVIPNGISSIVGEHYLDDLDQFDLLVRTPGLSTSAILDKNPGVGNKITTQVNEFFRVCPTKNVIGVTGTKGKGTTSTLITALLEAVGKNVRLGGNIGVPPLSFLNDLTAESWVVLELSNFQLIDMKASPHIAVCLAIVPEHLDWHKDMNDYVEAKSHIFSSQTKDDIAIYFAENDISKEIASKSPGHTIPYYSLPGAIVKDDAIVIDGQVLCKTSELQLPGDHNWQNVCAAVTATWQITQDAQAMRTVLTTFTALEHRIEFVREVDGVRYYNDSYAAGLQATKAAIEAVEGKKVMILGGYDRMLDLDHFGPYALSRQDDFRTLLLIGASAQRLAESLKKTGFTNYVVKADAKTMEAIVGEARTLAQPGDAIVLSPGFASFDMFKNFSERGQQFKAVVQSL